MPTVVRLDCGSIFAFEFRIRKQYPADVHYVRCYEPHHPLRTTQWRKVVRYAFVSNVPGGIKIIVPRRIVRIQPTAPKHRREPNIYQREFG